MWLGDSYYELKSFDKAIELYHRATDRNPFNMQTFIKLGNLKLLTSKKGKYILKSFNGKKE